MNDKKQEKKHNKTNGKMKKREDNYNNDKTER